MKYRIFIVACIALLIAGCGNKQPLAPDSKELALNQQDAVLAKGPNVQITPWEGVESRLEDPDPGKQWVSEDGVLHVRGRVFVDKLETDEIRVAGIITVTCDYDLNLATGSGTYSSKWSLATQGLAGTWKGKLFGEFTNYLFSGFGLGKGFDDLKGLEITVELNEDPNHPGIGRNLASGYIFDKK
ncbi:MAG: hypothetical protein MUC94_12585 [bacterium]|jgi:hypothetical protein|nr:hypothetical protein [bacterium]